MSSSLATPNPEPMDISDDSGECSDEDFEKISLAPVSRAKKRKSTD
jgi:hypothetical protein